MRIEALRRLIRGSPLRWRNLARAGAVAAAMAGASCAAPPAPALDAGKVASVVIGRSSRADVFAALGRPARTEQGTQGETWIYESGGDGGGRSGLGSTAAAASGVVGAFVPYVGLIGSGLGLASAVRGSGATPDTVSLAIRFDNGVVRDCTVSSTALPRGVPGAAADAGPALGCQRPPLALVR